MCQMQVHSGKESRGCFEKSITFIAFKNNLSKRPCNMKVIWIENIHEWTPKESKELVVG